MTSEKNKAKVYALKFTSKDAEVAEWMASQNQKSKSIELGIRLLIAMYGTDDLYMSALERLLLSMRLQNSGEPNTTSTNTIAKIGAVDAIKILEPEKKQVVKTKKATATKVLDDKPLDPTALLSASEKKSKKSDNAVPSADAILAMMSDQAKGL